MNGSPRIIKINSFFIITPEPVLIDSINQVQANLWFPQNYPVNGSVYTVLQALVQKKRSGSIPPAPVARAAFHKIIMQYSCKSYNMVVYIILTLQNK